MSSSRMYASCRTISRLSIRTVSSFVSSCHPNVIGSVWNRVPTCKLSSIASRKHLLTCTRRSPFNPCPLFVQSRALFGMGDELSAVKKELEKIHQGKEQENEVTQQQLSLFKALSKDISVPTIGLVAKLNCETKLPPLNVYELAVAVLEASNNVTDGKYLLELAATIFGYAGDEGDHNAQYTYAQLLRTGQGVETDTKKAADMLSDLAMKGHPYAQFTLGGMYYSGSGVEQSFQKAYTLYKVSSQNYVTRAFSILGSMHQHGQGVQEDIKLAVEFYQKGCDAGDAHALISMAQCYTHGKGVELSIQKAFEHYLEASKSNNPLALYNVATHYFSGLGVPQDLTKAKEYYEKASILGFYPAQLNLGNMYYTGLGVEKDKGRAMELFKLAAEVDDNAKEILKTIEAEEKKALEQGEGPGGGVKG